MKKLIKSLRLIKSVHVFDWNILMGIRELICSKKIKVVEYEICNRYDEEFYSNYIYNKENYCTYQKCFILDFRYINCLTCIVTIYNGDNLYGTRQEKRFSVTVELPDNFIENISNDIYSNLVDYFDNEYKNKLDEKRKKWIKNQISLI